MRVHDVVLSFFPSIYSISNVSHLSVLFLNYFKIIMFLFCVLAFKKKNLFPIAFFLFGMLFN